MLREHGITKILFMINGEGGREKGRTFFPNNGSEGLTLIYSPLPLYFF
jgi:hypothetical protein